VEDHLNRSLILWVYNSEFDVVREVELVPNRGWGGEGALGAVLGFGALHRLPVGIGEEVQAPGEKLFDADRGSTDYTYNTADDAQFLPQPPVPLAPPPMVNPNLPPPPMLSPNAPPPATAPPRARRGKHHGAMSPNNAFEDIFAEGAKKSAEDFASSRKGTPVAPPPKLGGPPRTATPQSATQEQQDTSGEGGEDVGEPGEAEVA